MFQTALVIAAYKVSMLTLEVVREKNVLVCTGVV